MLLWLMPECKFRSAPSCFLSVPFQNVAVVKDFRKSSITIRRLFNDCLRDSLESNENGMIKSSFRENLNFVMRVVFEKVSATGACHVKVIYKTSVLLTILPKANCKT